MEDENGLGGLNPPPSDFVGIDDAAAVGEAAALGEGACSDRAAGMGRQADFEASSLAVAPASDNICEGAPALPSAAGPGPGAGGCPDTPVQRPAELWPHAEGGVWLDCPARRPWALHTARSKPARARPAGRPETGAPGYWGKGGRPLRRRCRVEWVKNADIASGDGDDCGGGGDGGEDDDEGTEEADYVVITLPVRMAFVQWAC